MAEKLGVQVIEQKQLKVIIPKGTPGAELNVLFYEKVGYGLITTRDIEIKFEYPNKEKMHG